MKISIRRTALEYLKHHARENKGREIYGWLLGVEQFINDEVHLFILASYSAHKYMTQSLVNAEPDNNELASIVDYLPIGINNLGQYHSHPNTVFHSDTDDVTLLNMSKLYENAISVVTNGEEVNLYRVIGNRVVQQEYTVIKSDKLYFDYFELEIPLKLDKETKRRKLDLEIETKIEPQLTQKIIDGLGIKKIKLEEVNLGKVKLNVEFNIPILDLERTLNIKSSNSDLVKRVKKYVLDLLYETFGHFNIKQISPDMIEYQGIPINIVSNSISRNTASNRANLLKSFGLSKEGDQWLTTAD